MMPDLDTLKGLGDFCVTYGPWAVAIFEGLFILKLLRDHKAERKDAEEKRLAEREFTIKRFEEYYAKLVKLSEASTAGHNKIAAKISAQYKEVHNLREAMQTFMTLIVEGMVKIKPVSDHPDLDATITDFLLDNECLEIVKKKKKEE